MGSAMKTAVCQGTPSSGMGKKDAEMLANNKNNVKSKDEMTPLKQAMTNPFEIGLHERLEQPSCFSPSCFSQVRSEQGTEASFRWSIDQMANLNPAEIDDVTCLQQSALTRIDFEYEEKAQEAINNYFSQRLIVPSPWLNTSGSVPRSMRTVSCASSEVLRKPAPTKTSQDASTQTTLTLPTNFDLQKHLGAFFTHLEASVAQDEDPSLSASTLRRKLFTQDDSSFDNKSSSSSVNLRLSRSKGPNDTFAPFKGHLSSSPVAEAGVLKRTSVSPLGPIDSPTISPIASCAVYDLNVSDDGSCKCGGAESMMMMSFVSQNTALSVLEADSPESRKHLQLNDTVQNSNQDTGYQTNSIKTPKNELRMSWTPTTFSTPSTKAQCSQLGMSIDEHNW